LGDGRWLLIDCLVEPDGHPAPLKYLSDIGVAPSSALKLSVATHWHDDHVEGISTAYSAAPQAIIAIPFAMNRPEVDAFLGNARRGGSERISSGVRELDAVAITRHSEKRAPFRLAKANTVLLRYEDVSSAHGQHITVEALSLSNGDAEAFVASLASVEAPEPGQRIMPFDPNDVSVALWISIGPHHILLGADLENTSDAERGWKAVLASPARPGGRARLIKIPHHGSSNAHIQELWQEMLAEQPVAALTTWNRGSKLPRSSDVQRILQLTLNAYATSRVDRKPLTRPATLQEAGVRIRAQHPRPGHVRARLDLAKSEEDWRVDLFNGALPLGELDA
jgi:beta-lactamase superfamily II metal-dependent hydrolase